MKQTPKLNECLRMMNVIKRIAFIQYWFCHAKSIKDIDNIVSCIAEMQAICRFRLFPMGVLRYKGNKNIPQECKEELRIYLKDIKDFEVVWNVLTDYEEVTEDDLRNEFWELLPNPNSETLHSYHDIIKHKVTTEFTLPKNISELNYLAIKKICQTSINKGWLSSAKADNIAVAVESIADMLQFKYSILCEIYNRYLQLGDNKNEISKQLINKDISLLDLPEELNTDRAKKYFDRAVKCGMMQKTTTGAEWLQPLVRLGYVCHKIFEAPRPISVLERYFGVSKLSASITYASCEAKHVSVKKWRNEIDNMIFFD